MTLRILVLSPVLMLAASCASLPPICQPGAARQAGYYAAIEGRPSDRAAGAQCSPTELFNEDYEVGYQEGLRKLCDLPAQERQGQADGAAGKPPAFPMGSFIYCENKDAMKGAYEKAHRDGLNSLCGQSVDELAQQAFHDGAKGASRPETAEKYALCEPARRRLIESTVTENFEQGLQEWCSADSVTREARRQARLGPSPIVPPSLSPCLTTFPELEVHYPAVFSAERKKFVESHCTYQAGLAEGQSDATRTNLRRQSSPEYCDSTESHAYFEGYLEGWKHGKDRLCDVAAAYDRGMEDARHGRTREYTMPILCPHDYQTKLYQQYLQGYRFVENQTTGR